MVNEPTFPPHIRKALLLYFKLVAAILGGTVILFFFYSIIAISRFR
jgi:hypothetical protein